MCRHFNFEATQSGPPTCAAYPQGIPNDIWEEYEGHGEFRGDEAQGLRFEPMEGVPEDVAAEWDSSVAEVKARGFK